MCGIAGWIDWKRDLSHQQPILEAMGKTLSRRGPDTSGIWLGPHAAFAHRRLIVVDPEGGSQPMVRQRGNQVYVITYNGELYNTPELRRELEARGYTFRGYSDTEVLLTAFIEWGADCLERLNGIFAFAIWDEAHQQAFLARDRLGVKPLFYAQRGDSLIFGSELKALLAHPAIRPEVDAEGLAEVVVMGPSRTPGHGIFRGVFEVKPGHYMVYDPEEYLEQRYREALSEVPRLPGEDPKEARMREISYLSITRFMPTLLDRKDRMGMAVGLEVRVPYCDHRLVEYVWNVPWSMKRCDNREKGILRRALSGILPEDVLMRRKSPYPKTHNSAYLEAVRSRVLEVLSDPDSPLPQVINPQAVRNFVRSKAAENGLPWFGQLMSGPQLFAYLIQLDAWLREYRVEILA